MTTVHIDPRGSLWKKWDLHLHSPGTKKNDGYGGDHEDVWERYCAALEESDVVAFGVTDYFSADGYFRTVKEFQKRYPNSTKVFFPNIELCTSDSINRRNEEVNIHVLISPHCKAEDITRFLSHLKTNRTDGSGRHVHASELRAQADFEAVTTTLQYIRDAIRDSFGAKVRLDENLLLIAAINSDGIRAPGGAKRKAALSDEYDKTCHGFFGNDSNRAYYLNPERLESGDRCDPKPVYAGSDCHSFRDVSEGLGKIQVQDGQVVRQPTWIKADVSFDGLRQTLFEPDLRVFIGDEPPVIGRVRENPRQYIRELIVSSEPSYDGRYGKWFKDVRIPLGSELVAIIGNKGAGKSAIADIIGLTGSTHNQVAVRNGKEEELFSFLIRDKFLKGNCASNFTATLEWHAGDPDIARLDGRTRTVATEKVEYLPQRYIERICANIGDDEFRQQLEEVIFGYVPEGERYEKSNLKELVGYLSEQAGKDIETALDALRRHNQEVIAVERKTSPDYRAEISSRLAARTAEVEAHNKIPPTEKPVPGEADQVKVDLVTKAINRLEELKASIQAAEEALTLAAKQTKDLSLAKQAIDRSAQALRQLEVNYEPLFSRAGISFRSVVNLDVNLAVLDQAIAESAKRENDEKSKLYSLDQLESLGLREEALSRARASSFVVARDEIERERVALVEQLDKPNREYQEYLQQRLKWSEVKLSLEGDPQNPAEGTLGWLKGELTRIDTEFPARQSALRERRLEATRVVFRKRQELAKFYSAVKQSIDREIKSFGQELGEYSISIDANLRLDVEFPDDFLNFINQAVRGSFHGTEDGRAQLGKVVEAVTNWGDERQVIDFVSKIVNLLESDSRQSAGKELDRRDISKQIRSQKTLGEFYDYLFGLSYLRTKYDLRIDGKDLSELSPGERGGLLLVFYLMLDKRTIPLVIDQPEDNLDNKSVYEILVRFLKKAKGRRQIIITTHNPNLAVVADAEQVIRVAIDKTGSSQERNRFRFVSGAIENPRINDEVVEILEGTRPAFENRRLKYRFRTA